MKKILITICAIFIAGFARADTIDINWLNTDGTTYDTTTCTVGGTLTLPTNPTKYGHTFIGWRAPYTPVEYLELTGTQYIDTGYKPNETTVVKTKLFATIADIAFFASRWSGSPTYDTFGACTGSHGRLIVYFGRYSDTKYALSPNILATNTVHDFELNLNNFVLDGVSYPITRSTFVSPFNLYLGSNNNEGNTREYLHGRLYPVKIYDNGTLVRDIIPVLDNNGVACMYDKVSNTFFYNAGTGTFAAGPVIAE